MLNHWIRYFPILDLVGVGDGLDILEVGSGRVGIGEFLERRFVGCDIAFGTAAIGDRIVPVIASGTHLPFGDNSFRTTLCLDTLEHIPRRDRSTVIRELVRVSRNMVIMACPMGDGARASDFSLQQWYDRKGRQAPVWLQEHMALAQDFPMQGELFSILESVGFEVEVINGEGCVLHSVLSRLEDLPVSGRLMRILSRKPWSHLIRPMIRLVGLTGTYRRYLIVRKR